MPLRTLAVALGAATIVAACGSSEGAKSMVRGGTTDTRRAAIPVANTPEDSLARLRADSARIEGSASAPIWIVEVSDFQCPYCRQFHEETYPIIKREYVDPGKARLAYINFPLAQHAAAWPAAEVAMCAGAQGKFWPMHDALFTAQSAWTGDRQREVFDSLAKRVGVDLAQLHGCIDRKTMRPLIQADEERAQEAGVASTPTFLIAGTKIEGALPVDDFRRAIDAALAKASPGSAH